MNNELEIFKKKLIYRAGHRGTKEMDMLLSSFVDKNINLFNKQLLNELDKFLNFYVRSYSNPYLSLKIIIMIKAILFIKF